MRKGVKGRAWTTAELEYLKKNAGILSKRDICKHLKRSSNSVRSKAEELRKSGENIVLRRFESRLRPCPSCGAMSARLGSNGFCEPCRRREQLATIEARISELLPTLTPEQRAIYEESESRTESRFERLPKRPSTLGMGLYMREKTLEAYTIECERITVRNLNRQIKAAQKRKERIEKKSK